MSNGSVQTGFSLTAHGRKNNAPRAFSLVELLVVLAIMTLIGAATVIGIAQFNHGRALTTAAHAVADFLDHARAYALANNTYVWVGFGENGGAVLLLAVASRDGSRYDPDEPAGAPLSNYCPLTQTSKLLKLDRLRLAATNRATTAEANEPPRPPVPTVYQLGADAFASDADGAPNPLTFTYPLGSVAPRYEFVKIVEFNALGEASKIGENTFNGPGPQDFMEIALQPTQGNSPAVAIQIEGFTGAIRIFFP
ncbi:MAG: type II secretion system GspH family protein [Verrucomicrobiales bacterium]|nr:type II secretion system GspH family protein [Verrucomicrobiales bacterium]